MYRSSARASHRGGALGKTLKRQRERPALPTSHDRVSSPSVESSRRVGAPAQVGRAASSGQRVPSSSPEASQYSGSASAMPSNIPLGLCQTSAEGGGAPAWRRGVISLKVALFNGARAQNITAADVCAALEVVLSPKLKTDLIGWLMQSSRKGGAPEVSRFYQILGEAGVWNCECCMLFVVGTRRHAVILEVGLLLETSC